MLEWKEKEALKLDQRLFGKGYVGLGIKKV
jgi:hypothetical protein